MIEWSHTVRLWAFALVIIGLGYLIGKVRDDLDDDELRPWVVWFRETKYRRGALAGTSAALGAIMLDYWVYEILIPRYNMHPVAGVSIAILGIIGLGAGFPLAKWFTETDYTAIKHP